MSSHLDAEAHSLLSWQLELEPVLVAPLLPHSTLFLSFFASEATCDAQALELALR